LQTSITASGLSSNLTGKILGSVLISVASPPEQQAIAAFLDRKTGELDALIAEKQRLLALLQEQRAALITQAVTKGLDPSTPMKASGVANGTGRSGALGGGASLFPL
jgi:type I restriction enzyme S subunit